MGQKALDATGCEQLTVLADRGYYNGDEVLACEGTGIVPCIPKTQTSANAKRGLFTVKLAFRTWRGRLGVSGRQDLTKGKVHQVRPRQYRSLSQPHRLLDLRTQAQLHARQAQAPEALGA